MNSLVALINALTAPVSLSALKAALIPIATGARPYKVYTALLTQTSTSAPTAIVLENTLSGTPTFAYVDPGEYTLTLTGEFVVDKTVVTYNLIAVDNLDDAYVANRASANVIDIKTYDAGTLANAILNKSFIEIRVYE
jgi:hypothetical protein